MTAIWGPMGWMTLHSVATIYPEAPSPSERQLMVSWLDAFRDTITCPSCKGHFTETLATYRAKFPGYLDSRQDFVIMSFRLHNAVNRRLHKPVYTNVADCVATLKNNFVSRRPQDYRVAYVNHIARHWKAFQDVTGIVALRKIQEMKKIEMEYLTPRDTGLTNLVLREDTVALPVGVLEQPQQVDSLYRVPIAPRTTSHIRGGFQIMVGGIRLRR
jgi:hypothetical protein